MLTKKVYDNYLAILKSELVPALGCTEPIAVAYAAAFLTLASFPGLKTKKAS